MNQAIQWSYVLAALLFALGIKLLGSADTARRGNALSAVGMFLAVVITLFHHSIVDFRLIMVSVAVGSLVGGLAARRIAMTAMPEMVALFNGFGGIASLLVAWAEFTKHSSTSTVSTLAILFAVLIGGLTFTGSLVAFAKLSELKLGGIRLGKVIAFPGQKWFNAGLVLLCVGVVGMLLVSTGEVSSLFILLVGLSFLLGCSGVFPIGGADMPVVVALLNSCSGVAACATGIAIQNNILIVAGSLVGASGMILTRIMCRSMNRSLAHVLFSGFGGGLSSSSASTDGEVNPISAQDAYYVLEAARSVVVVPGYGLAVAQAQHTVKELATQLEALGCDVRYAIHPVAGRMPGHMNVLLAEADVPYDALAEMDDINPLLGGVDVCLVIGANDVVNPAAREDEGSPIYGMPIINVDNARNVIVCKRSMSTGFAGVQNPLFFKENTRMLFGDAKASLQELISEFKHA
jgi:NAD(P) transhydrogenase subunit beta